MKRVLLGLSYGLQGVGSLTLALLVFLSSFASMQGFIVGFIVVVPLLVPSTLSLVTALNLFRKNVNPTSLEELGTLTSVFFIVLYGILVGMPTYSNIKMGYDVYQSSIRFLVYLGIVVLNVMSIFGLHSFPPPKEERMHPYTPKDTYASLIPKGRFCKQCGKLVSVELGSCPNCEKELE